MELVGCFLDKAERAMRGPNFQSHYMTIDLCVSSCKGMVSLTLLIRDNMFIFVNGTLCVTISMRIYPVPSLVNYFISLKICTKQMCCKYQCNNT